MYDFEPEKLLIFDLTEQCPPLFFFCLPGYLLIPSFHDHWVTLIIGFSLNRIFILHGLTYKPTKILYFLTIFEDLTRTHLIEITVWCNFGNLLIG